MKEFQEKNLARNVAIFEKLLSSNNGGDGFFVGDSVS